MILIMLAQQLLPHDDGMRAAVLFLGASLCSAVFFMVIYPLIERLVADNSRMYYLQLYQNQMNLQQERIRKLEEELMASRKKQ